MSFYDLFKNMLGIPSGNSDNFHNQRPNNFNENSANRVWDNGEGYEDENMRNETDSRNDEMGFNIFTNPLEMHRYFEHQLNEVIKSFGGMLDSNNGSSFFNFGDASSLSPPLQPEYPQIEPPKGNLRDQFLKPGYENGRDKCVGTQRSDSDLDGRINIGDIDSILKDKPTQEVAPYQPNRAPQIKMFGQSMTYRKIQRSDGSIETHQTVKNQDGNEETTVTRQVGDKQYSVTTRRNKDGQEEKIEDMINLNENDLSQFDSMWGQSRELPQPEDPNKWFPFDKFFK